MKIRCKDQLVDLSIPKIVGILNLTPDSFYDGGRYNSHDRALKHVEKMLLEGADFIDVGATSTRPGAAINDAKTEEDNLFPFLELLTKHFPEAKFSIDTYHSSVAEGCILRGAVLINDISGGRMDPLMFETVGKYKVPYVLTHIQGTPADMQSNPSYNHATEEVQFYFSKKINDASEAGIDDIIIDPGFGFGKTLENNYELLQNLAIFHTHSCPVMVGVSRKSMIYKLLGNTPLEALNGSTVLHTVALLKGAHFLRVHDVKMAKECVLLLQALQ